MAMLEIRIMGMTVPDLDVPMQVRVGLGGVKTGLVFVLVVLVVTVLVAVFQLLVLVVVLEAAKLGHGGTEYVSNLFGIDPKTVRRGLADLEETEDPSPGRVRKKGAA